MTDTSHEMSIETEVVPEVTAEAVTETPVEPPKPTATVYNMSQFEMPKFEMPTMEMPKMEVPAAFREFAEKGLSQAKDNYEKMKSMAEETTDMFEGTYNTACKGCTDYGLKMIETARANSDAAFDLMTSLMGVKSYSEAVELTSGYMRKQFETLTTQAKEFSEHAQKIATDTA
ncbi:MAG: phasin, partial [Pseudolabrys sp.]